jgi:hypothetical protein
VDKLKNIFIDADFGWEMKVNRTFTKPELSFDVVLHYVDPSKAKFSLYVKRCDHATNPKDNKCYRICPYYHHSPQLPTEIDFTTSGGIKRTDDHKILWLRCEGIQDKIFGLSSSVIYGANSSSLPSATSVGKFSKISSTLKESSKQPPDYPLPPPGPFY